MTGEEAYIKNLETARLTQVGIIFRLDEQLEAQTVCVEELTKTVGSVTKQRDKAEKQCKQEEISVNELSLHCQDVEEQVKVYKTVAHLYWEAENQFDHRSERVDKLIKAIKQMLEMEKDNKGQL